MLSGCNVNFLDIFGVPSLCFRPNDHFLNSRGVLKALPPSFFACLNDCALVSLGLIFGELVADDEFSFCAMLGCDP